MAVGNTNADTLLLGADERGVFVRAQGSIRATLCFPLRDALLGKIDKGLAVPAVFIDLSECRYMDSTFIGLLVAMDKKLRKATGARLNVLRPSPESVDILSQIGLQKYLHILQEDIPFPAVMEALACSGPAPSSS
jgi:anti-anti-sigma factor